MFLKYHDVVLYDVTKTSCSTVWTVCNDVKFYIYKNFVVKMRFLKQNVYMKFIHKFLIMSCSFKRKKLSLFRFY